MKLHIGGEQKKEGWHILNIQPKEGVDYIGDINDLNQFDANSIQEIYASHVIEHVSQGNVLKTFDGIRRVLCPGGKFSVSVPDMDILCHSFISPVTSPAVKWHVMRMMFGGQVDAHDYHFVGWNQAFMFDFLQRAGFLTASRVDSFGLFMDTSEFRPYGFPISLNVIAVK